MAFLVVEIEFPHLSVADISDRTGFKGNLQDDLNGAVNLVAAAMAGTQWLGSGQVNVRADSLVDTALPIPAPNSLIKDLMGAYTNFSGLAASTLTNTGSSVVTGDIGVSPGTSVTGFPPGTKTGVIRLNDSVAQAAHASAILAYNSLLLKPTTSDLSGQDLGGMNLSAGVYNFATSAQLTGTLTLTGSADDRFIFKIGTSLTTATSAQIILAGGAVPDNVVFQVGSSATVGTSTAFQGNIFALQSVTANTSATNLHGRFIAINAAVTLDTNTIG